MDEAGIGMVSSAKFLEAVYSKLEFKTGAGYFKLLDSEDIAPDLGQSSWIKQARSIGAESIFFVNGFPTVLFFNLDATPSASVEQIEEKIRDLHVKVWNTSLIPLFFVALPGELRVYSSYKKPMRDANIWRSKDRWLRRIEEITQLLELWEFSRPEIESGNLFRQKAGEFNRANRVDQLLLKNLRLLRERLEGEGGGKREYAHALIGRSIFIRYLEDRQVLVEGYFLGNTVSRNGRYRRYTDVLDNKEDTYNLFHKLGSDFNGDLFPLSDTEERLIDENDLHTLRDFLLGRSMGDQIDLFFWAYKFDIIPIELISSIYEEFYHEFGGEKDKGTQYTPMPLVDLVLTETLTPERLNSEARVLDCACGSGVFLVEAFKRMVYHECARRHVQPFDLSHEQLIKLLTERITGIDVNFPSVQVAAFSLYLSFLDFRKPPDIMQHTQLPKLIYDETQEGKTLYWLNTFYPTSEEKTDLEHRLNGKYPFNKRDIAQSVLKQQVLPLDGDRFDVIIGNPPWGSLKQKENQLPVEWCAAFGYPVGDKELSQCFIWRTRHLLKPGGEIGLLVSTGVFFKHSEQSKAFRMSWLRGNCIRAVYNFAHVRHIFFRKQKKEAIAPFAAVFFKPAAEEDPVQNRLFYCVAKQSAFIERLQAVILDKSDFKRLRQEDLLENDWLWKACMWGTPNDVELIGELKGCYKELKNVVDDYGEGYKINGTPKLKNTSDLGVEDELSTDELARSPEFIQSVKPIKHQKIHRTGKKEIYRGPRLLIKRGVSHSGRKLGDIQARLADKPFAFKNSIEAFRLDGLGAKEREVLLGIVLSSLAKYYHFLTCSTWGFWHYEIHEEEQLSLPVQFPETESLRSRIVQAVRNITAEYGSNNALQPVLSPGSLQYDLDDAIFDLYGLSKSQRDLVRDLCQVTLDFYYNGMKSDAVKRPRINLLEEYRDAFLEIWQERLATRNMQLECCIYAPQRSLLVGMAFELKGVGSEVVHRSITDDHDFEMWFGRLSKIVMKEVISGIYVDRIVKMLTESSILVVKRAEIRQWTKSQARADAQGMLTEVFKIEWESVQS